MQLNPYLLFNGQCEEAFKLREVLGGKIVAMMSHEGTPAGEHVPPEWRKKIMHARLSMGDEVLMGSDAPPDRYEPMKGLRDLGVDGPQRRPSGYFMPWRKTERCGCRSRKLSGPSGSACSSINSARRG